MAQKYKMWKIRDFSAGQIEKLNDNILPDNASYECRNFISSRFGGLSKRRGQEQVGPTIPGGHIQGLHPYYSRTTNDRYLIAMAGGAPYMWDGSTWTELVPASGGGDIQFPDTRYPLVGTFLFGDGLTPATGSVMWGEQDSFTTLDPAAPVLFVDAVNYFVGMNGINQPFKYDGVNITDLLNAPATGRYPILHKEKIFCVDAADPSTLVWSDSFAPETWPAINYWDIAKDDGDVITCLVKYIDDLVIFKNRSCYALKGTSLDDFVLQEINSRMGCVGPRAAAMHELKVFFISESGFCTTNGMNVINISEMVIPDIWANVNKQYLHKAVLGVWEDLIWIAVPYGSGTDNNMIIMYDPKKQAFFPMDNIDVSCFTYFNDGTGLKLFAGDPNTGRVSIQAIGTEDFGSPVEAYWRGKFFDMDMPELEKKSRKVFVQDSPSTAGTIDISVCLDYETDVGGDLVYNNLSYYRTENYTREYNLDYDKNRWRYISPLVKHESAGNCEIRGILIPYRSKSTPAVRS